MLRKDQIAHNIGNNCRGKISKASALATVLDLQPLRFAESRDGLTSFAKALFESVSRFPM